MKSPLRLSVVLETSSSQPCPANSAVQITSMPSTSHSLDLARRRWISCVRWSSADVGSSRSLALESGYFLLYRLTMLENAPVVSLPMHQVTSPEAFGAGADLAFFVTSLPPPPPPPPPPQPATAKAKAKAKAKASTASTTTLSRRCLMLSLPPLSGTPANRLYPASVAFTRLFR